MNYLIGPLIERIVVMYAIDGRDPLPEDVRVAAEWNYRIWRHSGRATEIVLRNMPASEQESRRPRSRLFDWFFS